MSSSGITSRDGSIRVVGGGVTVDLSAVGGGGGVELGQDLGGTNTDPVVIGIQTIPVSATTPTAGEALILSGGVWTPTAIPLGISPGTGIGVSALAGIYTISNTGVVSFNTRTGSVTLTAADVEALFGSSGDLFVGTGSGAGTLLARGTTGQVLAVKSDGSLYWIDPPAGGVVSVTAGAGGSLAISPTTGAVVASRAALTGDVTASADSNVTTIKTNVALAGSPTTTTQAASDNSTKVATTAYADGAVATASATLTPTTGWIPDSNTWTYSSLGTSKHTSILTVNADLTGVIGLGDRIKLTDVSTQYFIVTAISVMTGTTTITMYGGAVAPILSASYAHGGGAVTSINVAALVHSIPSGSPIIFANGDTAATTAPAAIGATSLSIGSTTPSTTNGGWYSGQSINCGKYTLSGGAITNPYYSHAKAPFGFNPDPTRWTEVLTEVNTQTQSSPTQGTWYNIGGLTLLVPIGTWRLMVSASVLIINSATGNCQAAFTLSTANNSESDPAFTAVVYTAGATFDIGLLSAGTRFKDIKIPTATPYYLNAIRSSAAGCTLIALDAAATVGVLRLSAVCAYL